MYKILEKLSFFSVPAFEIDLVPRGKNTVSYSLDEVVSSIKNADLAQLKSILDSGFDANSRDKRGYSLIHLATLNARASNEDKMVAIIKSLIDHGGDVNGYYIKDHYGALTTAVRRKLPSIVKLLLDHGADTSLRIINHEKTAFDYAAEFTDENDQRGKSVLMCFANYQRPEANTNRKTT